MRIWLINHYAVPPQYYPLARPSLFAKNLMKMGHDVTIIAASTVHNSNCQNLIEDKATVKHLTDNGIPYVLVNCRPYKGNGKDRIINIFQFAQKLSTVLDTLERPDVIVATSFDPLSCYAGIKYANKHGIKAIAEIADLWPETLVAYSGVSSKNLLVRYLRNIEKKIYTQAYRVVFTMEGAYDYIVEQGWDHLIPREKIVYINNGVDLEQFKYYRDHKKIEDEDLKNSQLFKVVYAGSIRKVNNLGKLLDVAKLVTNENIKFLIWGDGDELDFLKDRTKTESITNVVFKGKVGKEFIPYITSCADLNFVHNSPSDLFRFGISFNKIFDYMAAGKPILCDFNSKYNPIITWNAGISVASGDVREIAEKIDELSNNHNVNELGLNALRAVEEEYNFSKLTEKLASSFE